jgi:hypothetical protein
MYTMLDVTSTTLYRLPCTRAHAHPPTRPLTHPPTHHLPTHSPMPTTSYTTRKATRSRLVSCTCLAATTHSQTTAAQAQARTQVPLRHRSTRMGVPTTQAPLRRSRRSPRGEPSPREGLVGHRLVGARLDQSRHTTRARHPPRPLRCR